MGWTQGRGKEAVMEVNEVITQARDTLTVKRVFGDPYEKDGVTVIPAARIQGGSRRQRVTRGSQAATPKAKARTSLPRRSVRRLVSSPHRTPAMKDSTTADQVSSAVIANRAASGGP